MTALAASAPPAGLLEAYADHQHLLGGAASYQRDRVTAARGFLEVHPDLDVWMARPVDARLVELARGKAVWPLVGFALLTGRCRADPELLLAKHFGHTLARWTVGLFPHEHARLVDAADRLGMGEASAAGLLRQALPMAVAFTGRPPSQLTVEDLDELAAVVDATQRLTLAMRRRWHAHVFALRRVLFEAGVLDEAPVHRRGGGRATRQARLGACARQGDPPHTAGLHRRTLSGVAPQHDRQAHQRASHIR